MSGPVVVAGATGFVGRNLVQRLVAEGRSVRCGSRRPEAAAERQPDLDFVALDVERVDTLDSALEGADALVYLVHQMSADHGADLGAHEAASAQRVIDACARAGVRRVVYLGGPCPQGEPSPHLAARLRTGEVLRSSSVSTIELRAGMIIGHGSESWAMCRDLAFRLPVMVLPSWVKTRSQPVSIHDVVAALSSAIDLRWQGSAWFDLPGPEVLTAREILERIGAQRGLAQVMVPLPFVSPGLSSHWLRFITRADFAVAKQLVVGLTSDLVCDDDGYWAHMPAHTLVPFDDAVAAALTLEGPGGRVSRTWERAVQRLAGRRRP